MPYGLHELKFVSVDGKLQLQLEETGLETKAEACRVPTLRSFVFNKGESLGDIANKAMNDVRLSIETAPGNAFVIGSGKKVGRTKSGHEKWIFPVQYFNLLQ